MATKGDQIRNLVKTLGGEPRNSTIEDAIEDLVDLFTEKREVEMVEIVPETEVETIYNESLGYCYNNHFVGISDTYIGGETYIVNFDGVEYQCMATKQETDEAPIHSIGDRYVRNWNDNIDGIFDYPFYITYGEGAAWGEIYTLEPGTHTISISQKKETVTPPVVSLGGADMVIEINSDNPYLENITHENFTVTKGVIKTIIDKFKQGNEPIINIVHNFIYGDSQAYSLFKIIGMDVQESDSREILYLTFIDWDASIHIIVLRNDNDYNNEVMSHSRYDIINAG